MDTYDSPRSSVPARLPVSRSSGSLAHRFGALQPEAAPSPISVRVALRAARRYWWLALALWAVGSAGIGAVIYKTVKPLYRAESLLRVDPSTRDIFVATTGENLDAFLQTQVDLIKSANILTAAATNTQAARLERIQLAGDVVLELRKAIQVGIRPGTYLIEVSMVSTSAHEAAVLVNAVVEAFNESNVEWSTGMTRNQIKSLENYSAELKNQSTELERQWKDIVARSEGGYIPVPGAAKANARPGSVSDTMTKEQMSLTVGEFQKLNKDLHEVTLKILFVEAWLASNRQGEQQVASAEMSTKDQAQMEVAIQRRLAEDPNLISLKAKCQDARAKYENNLRVIRDPSDPAIRLSRSRYETAKVQYQDAYVAKDQSIREGGDGNNGGFDPAREVREKEAEAQNLRITKDTLEKELKKFRAENKQQATDGVEIEIIREQRAEFTSMQISVNKRLEQLKFESKGENRIRTVQAAVAPGKPIADKRMQYLAMTPVGILAGVLGLVVLLEIRSGRVADTDLLSSRVRHEVYSIAPLPNIRLGEDAGDDRAEQRLARFVQSLDHLRVALCEGGVPGEGRCVMITSATGGEGKTTLSAHLAARCANAGTSTLLIDADMRRASLGRLLDVPAGVGLGDVLAGEIGLDEALITVQAGGFHFLSAGLPGRDPSRVLRSARLAELIGRLRQSYDLIIIDTPPILPVADALIMGRWADGAVVAARYDASRLPLVERANRQLATAGIPVLGVVVNGVRGQSANYGNYAYSYNYPGRSEVSARPPTA